MQQVMDQVISLPFLAQARSTWAMKTRKEKNEDPYFPVDQANEPNKMFIIWLC